MSANHSLQNQTWRRRLFRGEWHWAALLMCWLGLSLVAASVPFIPLPYVRRPGPPEMVGRLFAVQLAGWLAWAALAPVVLWLRRRFPLERQHWLGSLPVHVLACVLLGGAHTVFVWALNETLVEPGLRGARPAAWVQLMFEWTRDLPFCALFYALVLGLASALDYYRQFRERALHAAQLEAQLTQAQLQMLKMQLHPHFLFNTLNGITGLVRDHENAAAVQMLVGLSELLRQTLDNAGQPEVPLRQELEWLELYLKLQQMRFSDRLQVRWDIAPDTLDALVPNLITQPLVENAIRHGLAPRAAPGLLVLSAQRVGARLELQISDDGVGLPPDWPGESQGGLGLANTEARLRQAFGADYTFTLERRAAGGVTARVSLPWQFAAEQGCRGQYRER